jgi:GTP diphosphokinase / guanosine-3',5'-bis(diphosphate) 3'-diphosphatase
MAPQLSRQDVDSTYDELKVKIREYNPRARLRLIKKALQVANEAHSGQKRESGDLYITHPVEVAKILIRMRADSATLCAGLLHDVVEDTSVSMKDVEKDFGDEVMQLVEGVTKIDKIHFHSKEDYTAENIRKILLATTKDIRVILIKLADRLHNMRTLKETKPEKQRRVAQETLHIYAPVAHKLGIFWIKGELEDLCLRFLNSDVYKKLAKSIAQKRSVREKVTEQIIVDVEHCLVEKKVKAHVFGRAKYFFSIYKKMQKKKLNFDQVYDLIAIRIITKTIPDCYAALGAVHDLWKPQPKRFKDYISVPKSNGYQSLHTTVMSTYGKLVEVQIRTAEMHSSAEYGIAAHWRYHGSARDKAFDKRIGLLKQMLEWKMHADDAKDFVETLKIDLFQDEIVVFTPKGDPITLRMNSSPVDFAYMVHSNVGDHCVQAKVNGKVVPLQHRLRSGDVIEILTRKNAKPSRQWLKFVKTSKAKTKIRQTLNIHSEDDPKKGIKKSIEVSEAELIRYLRIGKKGHPKISKCCNPRRGDKIRAFMTKDKKVTIHRLECPNVFTLDPSREVPIAWTKNEVLNQANCMILVKDRVGVLAEIMNIIASLKLNITSIHSKNKRDRVLIKVKIHITDEGSVDKLKKAFKKVKDIIDLKINA